MYTAPHSPSYRSENGSRYKVDAGLLSFANTLVDTPPHSPSCRSENVSRLAGEVGILFVVHSNLAMQLAVSRAAPSDMSISSVKKRQESGKKKIPRTSSAIKKPPVTRQYTRRTRFQRQKKDVSMEDGSDQSEVGDSSSKVLPLVANTFNGPRTTRRRMQGVYLCNALCLARSVLCV